MNGPTHIPVVKSSYLYKDLWRVWGETACLSPHLTSHLEVFALTVSHSETSHATPKPFLFVTNLLYTHSNSKKVKTFFGGGRHCDRGMCRHTYICEYRTKDTAQWLGTYLVSARPWVWLLQHKHMDTQLKHRRWKHLYIMKWSEFLPFLLK